MVKASVSIEEFLTPLQIDLEKVHALSELFLQNFEQLAAESEEQFLTTPISESILRPTGARGQGW